MGWPDLLDLSPLRQNAADLRALRLNRTLTWLAVVSYPEADAERTTVLRGLATERSCGLVTSSSNTVTGPSYP